MVVVVCVCVCVCLWGGGGLSEFAHAFELIKLTDGLSSEPMIYRITFCSF